MSFFYSKLVNFPEVGHPFKLITPEVGPPSTLEADVRIDQFAVYEWPKTPILNVIQVLLSKKLRKDLGQISNI